MNGASAQAALSRFRSGIGGAAGQQPRSRRPSRRVLMTVDAAGGVWRYAMELARGLEPFGFDVVFVGQGPKPTAAQEAEAKARGLFVWTDDPLDWMAGDEAELARVPRTLASLVEEWQPDLLHLNNPSQRVGLLVDMPVLVVSHSCVATWWQAVKAGPLPPDWQWQFRRQRDGLTQADAVVAPSKSHAALLRRTYGRLPDLSVVPNAISVHLEAAKKEETVFAAARWWDEGKNAAILDRAAASISWPVFMAGPTEGPGGGRVTIANAANQDLSYAEVLKRVSSAGIFVSPSLYEPFGLAALEAARAGAALVLSDIPTYRELWSDAAVFFDPRDAGDLAAKIDYVAADPQLRADLGKRAIARSHRFTPDLQARTMAAIYGELLDAVRPKAVLENWA